MDLKFDDFFFDLWGYKPYAWQSTLATQVIDTKNWPSTIALPTGSGKTACLDIAIFALAVADRMPRRIFFTVDRRLIVDEVYKRAAQISEKLENSKKDVIKEVARNLLSINYKSAKKPLEYYRLRGGIQQLDNWVLNPLQPTVIATTVDQLGSALLFRAYGHRSYTWPIYAGLSSTDSLIILDEAHCAQSFQKCLQYIQGYRELGYELMHNSQYVIMSATPPNGSNTPFSDVSAERFDVSTELGRRQLASKPVILQQTKNVVNTLVKTARDFVKRHKTVVVFANRVNTARKVHQALQKTGKVESVLLTGRMRQYDKDIVVNKYLKPLQSNDSENDRPQIVVATQTLEVGADLDFDSLVTECASLDALRQRFGRLNRAGRSVNAEASIVIEEKSNTNDPVYGKALHATSKWLKSLGTIDFGIIYMEKELSQVNVDELNAPSARSPTLLPAHIDCLAQTNPVPIPSPDISLFLRGEQAGRSEVQVCLRSDVQLEDDSHDEEMLDALRLCPPTIAETFPVPFYTFQKWFAGKMKEDNSADVQQGEEQNDDKRIDTDDDAMNARIIRWKGKKHTKTDDIINSLEQITPGDLFIIGTDHPYKPAKLVDIPHNVPLDICDYADADKKRLRVNEYVIKQWPVPDGTKSQILNTLKDVRQSYETTGDDIEKYVRQMLSDIIKNTQEMPELSRLASEFLDASNLVDVIHITYNGIILIPKSAKFRYSTVKNGHLLENHLMDVRNRAAEYANNGILPKDIGNAIACAGWLHDLGKADKRFQMKLHDGRPSTELLAKSVGSQRRKKNNWMQTTTKHLPTGWRHELLSVRLAQNIKPDTVMPSDTVMHDLVLHLVASHHGRCRPFAPAIPDDDALDTNIELQNGHSSSWSGSTNLERLDSGVSERYWHLTDYFGWWGLAYLESLLRIADWAESGGHE